MARLPKNHWYHLTKFAALRGNIDLGEAVEKLLSIGTYSDEDWLSSQNYDLQSIPEYMEIEGISIDDSKLSKIIQGLPKRIHPIAHSRYSEEVEIIPAPEKLTAAKWRDITIYDWKRQSTHNQGNTIREVFELVKDLFPKNFSLDDYFAYYFFGSQFLDPVTRPSKYAIRKCNGICIDVGAYVGFKAFAMSLFNNGNQVYAYELCPRNFELLALNTKVNKQNIIPVQAGVSDSEKILALPARINPDMARSLESESINEKDQKISINHSVSETLSNFVPITTLDKESRVIFANNHRIELIHISVNGHEPEAVMGGLNLLKRCRTIRVVTPYSRDGVPVYETTKQILEKAGIKVFGKNQSAVLAGLKADGIDYTKA